MWAIFVLGLLFAIFVMRAARREAYTPPYGLPISETPSVLPPPAVTDLADPGRASSMAARAAALQYDSSLRDPTQVKVTTEGPFQPTSARPGSRRFLGASRDCLHLKSPSTLIQLCQGCPPYMLKTSSQWYLARPDENQVILCPQGWMDLVNPAQYWYSHLITFDEYSRRLAASTSGPVGFPEMKNDQPF